VLNLIPVWALDGGQAASAMDKTERLGRLTACLAFWRLLGQSLFFLVALGAGIPLVYKGHAPAP
jgi:Zn-dependent protease